jgi:hypothetical protein
MDRVAALWMITMRDAINMKQTTRLHDLFHPMVIFHIMGWRKPMRVRLDLPRAFEPELYVVPAQGSLNSRIISREFPEKCHYG